MRLSTDSELKKGAMRGARYERKRPDLLDAARERHIAERKAEHGGMAMPDTGCEKGFESRRKIRHSSTPGNSQS